MICKFGTFCHDASLVVEICINLAETAQCTFNANVALMTSCKLTSTSVFSSRFGSEPPSVEDDVNVWRYTILELHARNDDDDECY